MTSIWRGGSWWQHEGRRRWWTRDRRAPTPPERVLWQALRRWSIDGLKFRRQVPLGRFIVDFYCAEKRLVVEVDGATHADPAADTARDAWLAAQGCTVMRFWNNEVMGNPDGVLAAIAGRAGQRGGGSGEKMAAGQHAAWLLRRRGEGTGLTGARSAAGGRW